MAQQTAVEFLSQKYNYVTWLRNRDEISPEVADNLRERYLNQAKQMEKEQMINFFLFFRNNGEKYLGMTIEQFVEQYYKETYAK